MKAAIELYNLTKFFGYKKAVDDVSFVQQPGRILGLLGPNGAGKTTILRMLLGLQKPTSGCALMEGVRIDKIPCPGRVVGAALDNTAFLPGRSAFFHLKTLSALLRLDERRIKSVLEQVGLSSDAKRPVREFSLGMRQRLVLAAALLGEPRIVVFDEPANGLDPIGIIWLRGVIKELACQGCAVLLSSHFLSELEMIIEDAVLLSEGKLVYSGTKCELLHASVVSASESIVLGRAIECLKRRTQLRELPGRKIWVKETQAEIEGALEQGGLSQLAVKVEPANLEAAFLALTMTTSAGAQ